MAHAPPAAVTAGALLKAAHAEGAAAEGGAGEDANFVLMNVEQQLGAATRTTPHYSGFDFASTDFSASSRPPAPSCSRGGDRDYSCGFGGFGAPAAPAAAPAAVFSFGGPAMSFGVPAASAPAFSLGFGFGGFGGGGFGSAPAMAMAPGPSPQAEAFSSAVGDSVMRCMASSARRA